MKLQLMSVCNQARGSVSKKKTLPNKKSLCKNRKQQLHEKINAAHVCTLNMTLLPGDLG